MRNPLFDGVAARARGGWEFGEVATMKTQDERDDWLRDAVAQQCEWNKVMAAALDSGLTWVDSVASALLAETANHEVK